MPLESYIRLWAEKQPAKTAVICGAESVTYEELWQQVTELSKEYQQTEGRAVVIRSTQSIRFLVQYLAVHLAGKAIVPLEEDCTDARQNAIQQAVGTCTIPDNVADILYTTGTTGQQKGIMISHKAIVADAENLISAMQFTEDLLFIISGPLNHIGS